MIERFDIAGYARISVDEELDRDNVSIENQKAIIEDFVHRKFPDSTLTFYEDRDRSGYTFEQREGYQTMRRGLKACTSHHIRDVMKHPEQEQMLKRLMTSWSPICCAASMVCKIKSKWLLINAASSSG